ncbi:MAG TPA: DUF2460 domain-containing protein [Bryobacteraceae bacterium]|nr:DUF2460 domain-containing protein [Bryobacteraceae bacterium]
MATFPKLKTNAVAQYPAGKSLRYQNQTLRFLDGVEQRYRDSSSPLHRWEIRLSELDETEMAAINSFFSDNQGSFGSFVFTDPWDGQQYPNCSLDADSLEAQAVAELSLSTSVVIRENRQ